MVSFTGKTVRVSGATSGFDPGIARFFAKDKAAVADLRKLGGDAGGCPKQFFNVEHCAVHCTDRASYVTGTVIPVDGGAILNPMPTRMEAFIDV